MDKLFLSFTLHIINSSTECNSEEWTKKGISLVRFIFILNILNIYAIILHWKYQAVKYSIWNLIRTLTGSALVVHTYTRVSGGVPEDGIPPKICPEDGIPNFWVEDRIRTYICLKLRYIRIELVYMIILSLKSISEVEYVCDEIFMLSFCIESTLAEDLIQKLKHASTR